MSKLIKIKNKKTQYIRLHHFLSSKQVWSRSNIVLDSLNRQSDQFHIWSVYSSSRKWICSGEKTGLERNAAATDLLINTGNKQTYMWKEAAADVGKHYDGEMCGVVKYVKSPELKWVFRWQTQVHASLCPTVSPLPEKPAGTAGSDC